MAEVGFEIDEERYASELRDIEDRYAEQQTELASGDLSKSEAHGMKKGGFTGKTAQFGETLQLYRPGGS